MFFYLLWGGQHRLRYPPRLSILLFLSISFGHTGSGICLAFFSYCSGLRLLRLLIQGQSAKEIAEALGMSPRTAETHRNHLMAKFAARNTAELVTRAHEGGYGVA